MPRAAHEPRRSHAAVRLHRLLGLPLLLLFLSFRNSSTVSSIHILVVAFVAYVVMKEKAGEPLFMEVTTKTPLQEKV